MTAATRIYLLAVGDKKRLVRATHPSHALMHVAREIATVSVASQDDLVEQLGKGLVVETVKAEQQRLPE